MFKINILIVFATAAFVSACSGDKASTAANEQATAPKLNYWVTTPDKSQLLTMSEAGVQAESTNPVITIDTATTYQTIDGFGFSLTGGSAMLINQRLTPETRRGLLTELFSREGDAIGVSYLRVSVGASDLDERVFSYADGKADPELKNFTLAEDEKNLIPVLKEILAISPDIKIMGSPWSAPVWMKTNGKAKGGSLQRKYFSTYADYFVKYIQGMAAHGITIDAITIQNEPEHPGNTPSMVMTATEQAEFVSKHLGPAFAKNNIKTKIVVYDHNCDHPEYPISILNDSEAKKYIDGSAFHLYLGDISALSKVHEAHPDRNVYFTEQWTSPEGSFGGDLQWHTVNLTIGATRNWSRNVLEWNLAADPEFNPHTDDGGCTMCQGALTIDGNNITRNVSYYIIAHASKFIWPGSVRVESNVPDGFSNVAFKRPDGKIVVLVINQTTREAQLGIRSGSNVSAIRLAGGAVATVVL